MVSSKIHDRSVTVRLMPLPQVLGKGARKDSNANQVEETAGGAGVVYSCSPRRMGCNTGVAFR
jgi:hypothetical protein